ncbi:NADH-quinone oxidoreductase subunit N [Taibaiella soli]|uniref:NADH-quinone oxidoreductase subunit N n=1 Tax=Taibaiella soli TaxID=1649169 RepID=A0A2W2ACN7_9BACT|nr:NADH-quinone oxidoreductase subunit N [Taibaiella soli]PZF73195.1 NADH-quinone oxidoreductase subunit N [Taibaiella soli]
MKAIIAATILGVIMMFSSILMKDKKAIITIAALLLAVLLGVNIWDVMATKKGSNFTFLFNNMILISREGLWFNMLMTGCTFLYVLLSGKDIARVGTHTAEYFALIFFILTGVYLLSSYNNLLILFIGIEILSIPQYILAGSDKKNLKSSEAALKYFLMGAFTTGILMMGVTLLYGSTGTFELTRMDFIHQSSVNGMSLAGIIFLIIAFGFKVSAAPMHTWTPDVYDGAPTPFTAFMATIVKSAAFYAFIRLFQNTFGGISNHWTIVLSIITALTLFIGNLTAVFQQSVKRMLAYSSIAQAGFMLFAILSNNAVASQGIIIYAVAYSVATIGMFAVLMKLKDYTYDGFNGLAKKEPVLAFVTTIFLLSLAGIPLTGGFMAKYFVLQAAIMQGQLFWLVIFALLMAAISAYYYFRVIIAMYFKQGNPELHEPLSSGDKFMLALTCVLVVLIGIAPQLFLASI